MSAIPMFRTFGGDLTLDDLKRLEARWITPDIAEIAGLRRVSSLDARDIIGRRGGNLSGVLIPNVRPGEESPREYRLRLDEPSKGGPKYLSPPGRGNLAYFSPLTTPEMLARVDLPVIITEGEFKTLALWRLASHPSAAPTFLPLGLSGVWSFRGTIGKVAGSNGERIDEKGVIADFDRLVWQERKVIIAFDADAQEKEQVRIARASLARELRNRGAKVAFLAWDIATGKGIDDHLAAVGPEAVLAEIAALDFERRDWRANLISSEKGKPHGIVANALMAIRSAPEWQGVLHFDESSLNTVAKALPPWVDGHALPFTWTDEDDIRTAAWLQHQGILATSVTAGQAVQTVAREHHFHPIRDYLDSLTWDGISRISDWLTLYLGAESSEYARSVGAKWLIGAVARVFKPGCKNDTCLILEGQQGTLKSTALRTLASPWFADEIADLGSKDAALQVRGVWLIELSELDAMSRSEVARVKAFMSRQTDRFRPPFGRRLIEAPRECVFAGTTNHGTYLKDETGGRRFWPVLCGRINIAELHRDRDHIWAEAVHRYRAGENWWLDDKSLVESAAAEQIQRYESDPWEEPLQGWLSGRETVSVSEVLTQCIEKPKQNWNQPDKNRVARCLRSAGWERFRERKGSLLEWRYRKVVER